MYTLFTPYTIKGRDKLNKLDKSKEMKALEKLLKTIPDDRLPIAQSLFKELVFMQNTLIELKIIVEKDGPIELFKQGKQEFYRENPALQGYNKTLQRYNQTVKQLIDLFPISQQKENDELLEFIKGD